MTPSRFNSVLTLPLGIAQVDLRQNSCILLGSVVLNEGQAFNVSFLSLQTVRINSTDTPQFLTSTLGLCYAGVYFQGDLPVHLPLGMPISGIVSVTPSLSQIGPFDSRRLSTPGTYDVFVVNNTSNIDLEVVVTGCGKIFVEG